MVPATTAASVLLVLLGLLGPSSQQGRVAPGVPPQQYQPQHHQQMGGHQMHHQPPPHPQQPPVQHHQQMHPQHPQHQVPVQQQVPMQQVPVHQQVPVQQQQHQYGQPQVPVHHAAPPQQILNVAHMAQEKEHHAYLGNIPVSMDHIKEHMEVPIDTSNMSEQELQFHYFKMHDADNNNKLDGCELIKSLIHWHVSHRDDHENTVENFTDQDLSNIMDQMLEKGDADKDGFLNYAEFIGSSGVRVNTG